MEKEEVEAKKKAIEDYLHNLVGTWESDKNDSIIVHCLPLGHYVSFCEDNSQMTKLLVDKSIVNVSGWQLLSASETTATWQRKADYKIENGSVVNGEFDEDLTWKRTKTNEGVS